MTWLHWTLGIMVLHIFYLHRKINKIADQLPKPPERDYEREILESTPVSSFYKHREEVRDFGPFSGE